MPLLIDKSFFFGQLSIPQLNDNAVQLNLQWFLNEYEPKLMGLLFGNDLYALIDANPADPPYDKILNGATYGENKKWVGLTYGTDPLKKSLIANYVYYWWMRNNMSSSTVAGEKETAVESASASSPRYKMARAWNEMVEQNISLNDFLNSNMADYPTYIGDPFKGIYGSTYSRRLTDRQELFKIISPYV